MPQHPKEQNITPTFTLTGEKILYPEHLTKYFILRGINIHTAHEILYNMKPVRDAKIVGDHRPSSAFLNFQTGKDCCVGYNPSCRHKPGAGCYKGQHHKDFPLPLLQVYAPPRSEEE